ncbi:pyocin knob domain-containing protein, partial [Acinetobacter baumannii]
MALPDIEQLIGSSVTEEGFKSALKQFLENVVGLDVFNANKFLKPRVITESIDWNDFREEGFFKFISGTTWDNCLNRPPINNQWAYGIILPVSNAVCGQFAWCFNAQKLVFRFSNASSVWPAEWTVFSGDVALTSIIKAAVNVDRDATFDARAVNSITPIFESLSKNFFDKNTPLLMNRRINQFGELEEHQKSITTPLISVAGMASIVVSGLQASPEAYRAYRFFDKDKKFIRNDSIYPNKTAKVITVPNNAAWFQITLKDGIDTWTLNTDTIQFESGNVATAYTPYI